MTQSIDFNWRRFCIHYENELRRLYSRIPAIAAEKTNELRLIESEFSNTVIEPDEIVDVLMRLLINNRGEVAAFCDPDKLEDPENLIEGYEWCVIKLNDKSVSRETRSFCAAQVGAFDERLQDFDVEI